MIFLVAVLAVVAVTAGALAWRTRRELAAARAEAEALREEVRRLHRGDNLPQRRSVRAVKAVMGSALENAQRLREGGVSALLAGSIEDFTTWVSEDRTAIARFASADGTVSILFSDIEDSTANNERLGDDDWVALLAAHDALVRRAVDRHGGHVVKSQGDGFMVVFGAPVAAVRAGIAMQDAIATASSRRLRRTPIRVRVGIHCGTAIERDGDFFGTNVAMAARVAAQARGGQILVSDEVRQQLRDESDIVLVDVVEAELKGLPGVHRLWEVAVL